MTMIYRLW